MSAVSITSGAAEPDEALTIKRDADSAFDFADTLEVLPDTTGMFMGNANIVPRQPLYIPLPCLSGLTM